MNLQKNNLYKAVGLKLVSALLFAMTGARQIT